MTREWSRQDVRTLKSVFIFKVQPYSSSSSCDEISQTLANLLKLFVGPSLSSGYRNACKGGTLVNWASPYLPT